MCFPCASCLPCLCLRGAQSGSKGSNTERLDVENAFITELKLMTGKKKHHVRAQLQSSTAPEPQEAPSRGAKAAAAPAEPEPSPSTKKGPSKAQADSKARLESLVLQNKVSASQAAKKGRK